MYSDEEIIGSFTNFIVKLIINASKDYKKSMFKKSISEIPMSSELETRVSLSINDKGIFCPFEDNIPYNKLENYLQNKNYYCAMKSLSDRQKHILYLSIVEQLSIKDISKLLKITENNVSKTKTLAIKTFLKNYGGKNGKDKK